MQTGIVQKKKSTAIVGWTSFRFVDRDTHTVSMGRSLSEPTLPGQRHVAASPIAVKDFVAGTHSGLTRGQKARPQHVAHNF